MSYEANVRKVVPYVPGEQPKVTNLIKLNTNENPYPPSPLVLQALKDMENNIERLKLYPDPTCEKLIDAISGAYNVDKEKIFLINVFPQSSPAFIPRMSRFQKQWI